jgi:hypothetical protein
MMALMSVTNNLLVNHFESSVTKLRPVLEKPRNHGQTVDGKDR